MTEPHVHVHMLWVGTETPGVLECAECGHRADCRPGADTVASGDKDNAMFIKGLDAAASAVGSIPVLQEGYVEAFMAGRNEGRVMALEAIERLREGR